MDRKLYLRLVKKWHPDSVADARFKAVCTRLTQLINDAFSRGDSDTLVQIEMLGLEFLNVENGSNDFQADSHRPTERPKPNTRSNSRHEESEEQAPENDAGFSDSNFENSNCQDSPDLHEVRDWVWFQVVSILSPYALLRSLIIDDGFEWRSNSGWKNILITCSAFLWFVLFLFLWGHVSALSLHLQSSGHNWSGWAGFVIVAARAVLALLVAPIVVPLLFGCFYAAVCICALYVVGWVLVGGIFHEIHPWLGILARGLTICVGGICFRTHFFSRRY